MGCSSSQTAPVSFRIRLLQHESPRGSQVLPAYLLQRGLLSPQVCRSHQEPAPAQALHRVTASFRHPPAPAWVLHRLQVEICSTMDLHGLQGDSLPHHSLLLDGLQRTSALVLGAPPCPPASLTLVFAELFFSHFTPLSAAVSTAVFYPPFLNTLSQRFYQHH